ncbi:transketolase [Alphaproteobacteria bacterium]|nr:transketolase [Alphaproteobacteria bacterium]
MRKESLKTVYNLAKKNKKILFIGSDLGFNVLDDMKKNLPKQFHMEGVSEQHIIGMSAGLAMDGFIPFVNTIATFLTRRCYEQIVIDLCLHNLPVRLLGNGAGGVYAPLGPTHLAIEDLSLMRNIPNMAVFSPSGPVEVRNIIKFLENYQSPAYIRIGKGGETDLYKNSDIFKVGKPIVLKKSNDFMIYSCGIMSHIALEVVNELKDNFNIGVMHFHTIKPLDEQYILRKSLKPKIIFTLEENILSGGFGSRILELFNNHDPSLCAKIRRFGIEDSFESVYGNQNNLLEFWGISKNKVKSRILEYLK